MLSRGVFFHEGPRSDLGPAIECDDDYIFGPDQVGSNSPFQQPKGKPSKVAFFNRMTNLYQLMGFVLNTIVRIPSLYLITTHLRRSIL
jgi:hypothetical protein